MVQVCGVLHHGREDHPGRIPRLVLFIRPVIQSVKIRIIYLIIVASSILNPTAGFKKTLIIMYSVNSLLNEVHNASQYG